MRAPGELCVMPSKALTSAGDLIGVLVTSSPRMMEFSLVVTSLTVPTKLTDLSSLVYFATLAKAPDA